MEFLILLFYIAIMIILKNRSNYNHYVEIEPNTERIIRKNNPNMTDVEIQYCLEYEADYFDIDINQLKGK